MQLGVELRARRLKAGLTQGELARAIDSTQPAIARIEAGSVVPSILFVDRWVAATGYPLTLGLDATPLAPATKRRLVRAVVGDGAFDPWKRLEAKRAQGIDVEPERRHLADSTRPRRRRE